MQKIPLSRVFILSVPEVCHFVLFLLALNFCRCVKTHCWKPPVCDVKRGTRIYNINILLLALPSETALLLPPRQKVQKFFFLQEATYSGIGPREEQAKAEHTQDGTANHSEDFQSHLRFTRHKGQTGRQGRVAAARR